MYLEGEGINGKTFQEFLRGMNARAKKPWALFIDNASYHGKEGGLVEKYCEKMDIALIKNVPYRPDFNAIEMVWARAKQNYRERLDWFKANGVPWV